MVSLTAKRESCPTKNVWIVNRSTHDFNGAERFGTLRFLSEGMLRKRNVAFMVRKFERALACSSEHDFLLPTSLTIMCMVAAVCFVRLHGRLNLLLFEDGKYKARSIVFDSEEKKEEHKDETD